MNVLIFPGQGSQKVGMAKAMVEAWPWAAELAARTDRILGRPLSTVCFEGPESALKETTTTQPAIFFTAALLVEALRRQQFLFGAAAGHSLGEYAALYAAGVASYDDLLRLVDERARAMETACPSGTGAMAAVMMLSREALEEAVEILARACHKHRAFLVHISTDFVFDGRQFLPYRETDDPNPLSVYGASKLEGEERAFAAHDRVSVIRTSWLYSKYGNNFVKTIGRLLAEKPEVRVIFDQVGTPTSARTLAEVIVNHIDFWEQASNAIYHYSNEGVASWYDFAVAIGRFFGLSTPVLPIHTEEYPTPAKRPHYSVLDKTKIKETLGIKIPHWMEPLEKTIHELSQGA
jgi:dTDP-4-dehydrorhamnose reductase